MRNLRNLRKEMRKMRAQVKGDGKESCLMKQQDKG